MAGGEHQSPEECGVCLRCQGFGQVEFPRLPSKKELPRPHRPVKEKRPPWPPLDWNWILQQI